MSRKSWIHQSLITLRGRPIRRLALISAIGLLLFAGIRESGVPAVAQFGPAEAQDQDRLAAQRNGGFESGAGGDVEGQGMGSSVLLGGVHTARRVAINRRLTRSGSDLPA
jgi:hypothetical protein